MQYFFSSIFYNFLNIFVIFFSICIFYLFLSFLFSERTCLHHFLVCQSGSKAAMSGFSQKAELQRASFSTQRSHEPGLFEQPPGGQLRAQHAGGYHAGRTPRSWGLQRPCFWHHLNGDKGDPIEKDYAAAAEFEPRRNAVRRSLLSCLSMGQGLKECSA